MKFLERGEHISEIEKIFAGGRPKLRIYLRNFFLKNLAKVESCYKKFIESILIKISENT